MKKLILLLVLFCTMSMTGQNVLTIDRTETKQTFILNGVSQGGDLVASEVDENTVRLRGEGRSADYKTKSGFTDFLIAGVNPTDVDNAVELINDITKKRTFDVVIQDFFLFLHGFLMDIKYELFHLFDHELLIVGTSKLILVAVREDIEATTL